MSRVGKRQIEIPAGVDVNVNGSTVTVKGPQGTLTRTFKEEVTVSVANNEITFTPTSETRFAKAYWGTVASHVGNMVEGVSKKFEKKLIIEGIGFRAEIKGRMIEMQLGFSHPVIMEIPEGLEAVSEKGTLTIIGIDKEAVTLFASQVKAKKKPEPYKGKGIRYDGEKIRRKEGKKGA